MRILVNNVFRQSDHKKYGNGIPESLREDRSALADWIIELFL